jgi:hypothetical protein
LFVSSSSSSSSSSSLLLLSFYMKYIWNQGHANIFTSQHLLCNNFLITSNISVTIFYYADLFWLLLSIFFCFFYSKKNKLWEQDIVTIQKEYQ